MTDDQVERLNQAAHEFVMLHGRHWDSHCLTVNPSLKPFENLEALIRRSRTEEERKRLERLWTAHRARALDEGNSPSP